MRKLELIKYANANAIEATWFDEALAADEKVTRVAVASIAYDATQRGLFIADCAKYGGNADDYSALWTDVEAAYAPPVPTADDLNKTVIAEISRLEATLTQRRLREALLTGDLSFIQSVEAQIAAIRAELS